MTTQKRGLPRATPRGFTFIEILVVIAVLAVLAAIMMLIINPAEYLRRARDAQRLGDAARITQAMALYTYGTASRPINQDPDGPKFPLVGSPPITDSCINDPIPHRLFVSVPNDNGEASPTAPTDWVYSRVTSTQLRSVDGNGWLPVDFTEALSGQTPFSVLPVDPVNTFASGYYYSYGCGSWNINMNFESQKYRDEVSSVDQGRFANVYEIGSDLTVLPEQERYNASSTESEAVIAGTLRLSPDGDNLSNHDWLGFPTYTFPNAYVNIVDNPNLAANTSDYISHGTINGTSYFTTHYDVATGTITGVRLVISAVKVGGNPVIQGLLRSKTSQFSPISFGSPIIVTGTINKFTSNTLTQVPVLDTDWTWDDINDLEIGIQYASGSGTARVSQMYLEIDYQ